MVNPRATAAVSSSSSSSSSPSSTAQINTAYSLSLISEYGHILDALPLDLSRGIGELRELDAVLSSSMITFTAKVHSLTCMIEERRGTKEERLYLLHEISEEAARLKCGGDDKIRAACTAADTLRSHVIHLHTLAERMPEFDMTSLKRRTIYPHVSDKSFMPLNMDAGRRRRGGTSGLLSNPNAVDPSPAKRKRLPRDEEIDISSGRSPHKRERLLGGDSTNPRSRLGRGKKNERIPSPSESLVSVTSHLPLQNPNGSSSARAGPSSTHASALANLNTSGRNANGAVAGSKRRGQGGGAANNTSNTTNTNNRVSTPLSTNDYPSHHSNSASTASHRGPNGLASSHHPSNSSSIPGYSNGTGNGNGGLVNGNAGHFNNGTGEDHMNSVSGSPDLNILSNQLLAGPGIVPHARSASVHSNATNANGAFGVGGGRNNNANLNAADGEGTDGGIGDAGDVDGDNDDNRTYCYCDGVSYGEMIACDDENCEREWFHLSCIGLTVCPEGSWFCDTCKNKRNNKRSGRGGKRRAAGNRTGGKA